MFKYAYCAVRMISVLQLSAKDLIIVGSEKSRFYCYYCNCYLDLSLHHMLKMSTLCANTGTKTLAPLLGCDIDNCLIKLRPLLNETSLQMVYVVNPHTIHSFQCNAFYAIQCNAFYQPFQASQGPVFQWKLL